MNQDRKMMILRLLIIAKDEKVDSRNPEFSLVCRALQYGKASNVTLDEINELLDSPLSSILKES